MGFLLRLRSFNELNNMIKGNEFGNILPKGIKPPQIDAIRDALKVIDIKGLKEILIHGISKVFRIIRARQDIENSIFHNLKAECGLEHCFVHGGNAMEAMICLMFISSNCVQLFYHRRVKLAIKARRERFFTYPIRLHII
jgi:hypothetical protein